MADEENKNPDPTPPPAAGTPEPVLESPAPSDDYIVEEEPPQDLEMSRDNTAAGKGKTRALITGFIMLVAMGLILWMLFSGNEESAPSAPKVTAVSPPTELVVSPTPPPPSPVPVGPKTPTVPSIPPVPPPPPPPAKPPLPPAPPPFTTPTALPPLPAPPPITKNPATAADGTAQGTPVPTPSGPPPTPDLSQLAPIPAGANDQAKQARLRSNMLILDSNAGGQVGGNAADSALGANDANTEFQQNVLKATKAEKMLATRLNNLSLTLAQGKVINAVLETAINTDLPGPLRAIVSRDVYTESGRYVAVPKGSRLIGVYNSKIIRGQSRVLIIWTRIIRPDGVDIMVGSPGIDSLGRAGIEGITDNKYSEIFSAAVLTSVISIGVAGVAEAISNDDSTTTTNSNGTTTTGSASALAAADAVGTVGNIGKSVVNTMLDLKPTITVDQGTLVSVFANKDLTFPVSSSGTQFVE